MRLYRKIQKVSENEYLVTGTASIDKVYEELDIDKEFDVFTVSGWIMGILERVPKEGRSFRLGWPRRNRTENGRPESRQGTDRAAAEG